MLKPAALPLVLVLGLLTNGCESERSQAKVEVDAAATTAADDQRSAIERDLDALAHGRDPNDAKESKLRDDAVRALIKRGSGIETALIDRLRRSDDWAVRLGIIEVLMATGTKASVDHLIVCLDDDEPLVALRANTTLQEMTQHAEIPAAGTAGANGLPPVPVRPANDLAMDAELRQWSLWHREHRAALRQAWATWWSANRDEFKIK
jgi:HEAT repeat protein